MKGKTGKKKTPAKKMAAGGTVGARSLFGGRDKPIDPTPLRYQGGKMPPESDYEYSSAGRAAGDTAVPKPKKPAKKPAKK